MLLKKVKVIPGTKEKDLTICITHPGGQEKARLLGHQIHFVVNVKKMVG